MVPLTAYGDGRTRGAQVGLSRRATAFAVAVLCLGLGARLSDVLTSGAVGQVPFTVALFVLPLLYAFRGTRRRLDRYRWPVLAVQAGLTWVPFALFGAAWQEGIGGLLAGLVLLMVPGRRAWLLAGGLLAAEVAGRAFGTGLPLHQAWMGISWVTTYYVDDALIVFGMVRLAQIVTEVDQARGQAADLAVARERLQAAGSLQAAVGQRLADVAARVASARQALSWDPALARAQIAAAGVTARDAVAQARSVMMAQGEPPRQAPPARQSGLIGARLAWGVLVTVLLMFSVENSAYVIYSRYGTRLTVLAIADIAGVIVLQLYHSGAARNGRKPRAWPLTLALQAVLIYAFLLPFVWVYIGALAPFLAGSVLLLIPGRWRWIGYVVTVASYAVLYSFLPLRGTAVPAGTQIPTAFYMAAVTAEVGLMVYGMSRLAALARELEALHDRLARMAAVRERLRVARDVHDLLGLGLSAVALKADLIGALIGRDDARAAAEIAEMSRVCASARADIRLVTGDERRLSLVAELAAAKQILASAGVEVRADVSTGIRGGPLPAAADEVLAPVLREAVTNVLRHAAATVCVIEVTVSGGALRLCVDNDGAWPGPAEVSLAGATGGGRGLANLDARMRAAGGRLETTQADGRFSLTAELRPAGARLARRQWSLLPAWRLVGQPAVEDAGAAGHGADRADEVLGRAVLEQVAGHPGA
jgi:two-component system, NarL family, sensor histidine kinase DesK